MAARAIAMAVFLLMAYVTPSFVADDTIASADVNQQVVALITQK